MDDRDRSQFIHALEQWAGRWPHKKWEPKHSQAYFMALRLHDLQDAIGGLRVAAERNQKPEFVPSADSVRAAANELRNERLRHEEERAKRKAEDDRARLAVNECPTNPAQAEAWVNEADDPFERLARKWQWDSRRMGLSPGDWTPRRVGKSRLKEFWETWARHGTAQRKAKPETTPEIPPEPHRPYREPGEDDVPEAAWTEHEGRALEPEPEEDCPV